MNIDLINIPTITKLTGLGGVEPTADFLSHKKMELSSLSQKQKRQLTDYDLYKAIKTTTKVSLTPDYSVKSRLYATPLLSSYGNYGTPPSFSPQSLYQLCEAFQDVSK